MPQRVDIPADIARSRPSSGESSRSLRHTGPSLPKRIENAELPARENTKPSWEDRKRPPALDLSKWSRNASLDTFRRCYPNGGEGTQPSPSPSPSAKPVTPLSAVSRTPSTVRAEELVAFAAACTSSSAPTSSRSYTPRLPVDVARATTPSQPKPAQSISGFQVSHSLAADATRQSLAKSSPAPSALSLQLARSQRTQATSPSAMSSVSSDTATPRASHPLMSLGHSESDDSSASSSVASSPPSSREIEEEVEGAEDPFKTPLSQVASLPSFGIDPWTSAMIAGTIAQRRRPESGHRSRASSGSVYSAPSIYSQDTYAGESPKWKDSEEPDASSSTLTYVSLGDRTPTKGTKFSEDAEDGDGKSLAESLDDSSAESSAGSAGKHAASYPSLSSLPEKPLPSLPSLASPPPAYSGDGGEKKRWPFASAAARGPSSPPRVVWAQKKTVEDCDLGSEYGYVRLSEASFDPGSDGERAVPALARKPSLKQPKGKGKGKARDDARAPRTVRFTAFPNRSDTSVATTRASVDRGSSSQGSAHARSSSHPSLADLRAQTRISRGVEVPVDSPPAYKPSTSSLGSAASSSLNEKREAPRRGAWLTRALPSDYADTQEALARSREDARRDAPDQAIPAGLTPVCSEAFRQRKRMSRVIAEIRWRQREGCLYEDDDEDGSDDGDDGDDMMFRSSPAALGVAGPSRVR